MKKYSSIEQLKQELQAKREERQSLSFQEQRAKTKEGSLKALLSVGYITADEAKEYGKPLEELPTDRKGLIVAYLNTEGYRDKAFTMEMNERVKEFLHTFHLSERGALQSSTTIGDVLSEEEQENFVNGLFAIQERERIRLAEAFVDGKRRILRRNLLPVVRFDMAQELLQEVKVGELDPIPYTRELLEESGYRFKAKSLNDGDKAAIESVATAVLDTLELAYLNGVGEERSEEIAKNSDENGNYKETFIYRDYYDELLATYPVAYYGIELAIQDFYTMESPRELRSSTRGLLETYKEMYPDIVAKVKGSKFNVYLEED